MDFVPRRGMACFHQSQFRSRGLRSSLLAWLILPLCASPSFAGTFLAFGPENYLRSSGSPVTITQSFTVLNPNTTYTLRITNGGPHSEFDNVSSATIVLNGVQIFGPNEFNQTVTLLEKPVTLASSNTLAVELRGKPGGGITLQIIGIDNDPPTITASASPPPNAAGWNNTPVAMNFTCSDATSGIATCPGPVAVTAEAANQVITGTAADRAGNTASTSVTLNIDRTSPAVAITSPIQGAIVRGTTVRVTGTVIETNSLTSLTVNGSPVTLTGSSFSADLSVAEGPQTVSVAAQDIAGNTGAASVSFTVAVAPTVDGGRHGCRA